MRIVALILRLAAATTGGAATGAGADTMYSICSISKLFTSVAVMQQCDAGKLKLDDPVAQHLPWSHPGRPGRLAARHGAGHPDPLEGYVTAKGRQYLVQGTGG